MIELRPHKGMVQVPGKASREVDIGQDRIFCDGICVGIIGRGFGAHVIITGHVSDSEKAAIVAHVNDVRGEEIADRPVAVAPKIRDDDDTPVEELPDDE